MQDYYVVILKAYVEQTKAPKLLGGLQLGQISVLNRLSTLLSFLGCLQFANAYRNIC